MHSNTCHKLKLIQIEIEQSTGEVVNTEQYCYNIPYCLNYEHSSGAHLGQTCFPKWRIQTLSMILTGTPYYISLVRDVLLLLHPRGHVLVQDY